MKRLTFLLHAGLMLVPTLALPALAADALWAKTMEHTKVAKQLIAKDIETNMTAVIGSDPIRTFHFKSQLSEWIKDKPVYIITPIDPVPDERKAAGQNGAKFMELMVVLEESLLVPDAKVKRTDGQKLDGKSWTVFQLEESGVGKKMLSKIWVDAETGCIHLIDTDAYATMNFDGNLKTSYDQDAQGRCLPRQTDADFEIPIPFMKTKMKVKQTSANWVARPN